MLVPHTHPPRAAGRRGPLEVEVTVLARVRISVPDRPGSLGQVASAIGAGGADIVQVDVLESAAGRALDDVVVQVRDTTHLQRVTAGLAALAGVAVVGVQHPAPPVTGHTELELVQRVLDQPARALQTLVDGAPAALGADWAALIEFEPDGGQRAVLATSTQAPPLEWIDVRAPLRLTVLRLTPPDGDPYAGSVLVPLAGTGVGLLLVRAEGLDFHATELWRLGHLGAVLGPLVGSA